MVRWIARALRLPLAIYRAGLWCWRILWSMPPDRVAWAAWSRLDPKTRRAPAPQVLWHVTASSAWPWVAALIQNLHRRRPA